MRKTVARAAFAASVSVAATAVAAQETAGRNEYMIACAGCHGETALGDGPLAGVLNIETPNLTTLSAEKGGGTFPYEYVLWMVDGRKIIRAHGDAMPVWGDRFQLSATSQRGETAEMVAKGRILSLVDYLSSIQQ